MNKDKQVLFFYMVFVTIGSVLMALALIKYILLENDSKGHLLMLLGFVLIISYMHYLENKAGISRKIIWVRNSSYTILVAFFTYFLFFQ